ncbi:MAG: flagellar biosynthesis protein FlhF [Phycisphaerales bacterium]
MANTTLKTYRAPTIGEALTQVKKDLGKDAVILHTRSYKAGSILGFFGKPMIEITASVGVNVVNPLELRRNGGIAGRSAAEPSRRGTGDSPKSGAADASGTDRRAAPASAIERAYGVAPAAARNGAPASAVAPRADGPTPQAARPNTADFDSARSEIAHANAIGSSGVSPLLRDELAAIKCMVAQVLQTSAKHGAAGACPTMPEPLLKFYMRLIQNDVSREIADQVASTIRDELTPAELGDEGIVRQSMLRQLETLIPTDPATAAPARTADGRALAIALVGPTGVGKTTTVAKLAAAYRLRHGKRVALITSDTYRIAAVDQLRTYAGIIGVPLHVAHSPEQMSEAIEACRDFDVVLIDTAGRSPGDSARLEELRGFLHAAQPHQVHLVLASVASESALLRTADQFAVVSPSRVIFTKLDEAASFGVLINVATRLKARLSFVTTGQEVPDDIEPGRADRLARLILDGSLAA